MVINFDWAPSTSASNLSDVQLRQLCSLLNITEGGSEVHSAVDQTLSGLTPLAIPRPSSFMVWLIGLFFVTLINMCAVVGIGVMRYLTKSTYNQVITFFVGLGVGSLSGSSFYHLLPQAHPSLVDAVGPDGLPTHDYLRMAHFSILGVYMFFMCDKVIKIVLEMRKRGRSGEYVGDENSTEWHMARRPSGHLSDGSGAALVLGNNGQPPAKVSAEIQLMQLEESAVKSMGDQAHGICVHDHSVEWKVGESAIAAVAWMIIFGDGFHNFIDGISIGASFRESIHSGISVSIAVLCEEFPHELGDVAILVASGMSLKQALVYNLLSALTCYLGFFIGVVIGDLGPDNVKYAFALAGGMFLYISLGCMMPEMKKAMEEALNVSLKHGLYVLMLQTCGLFTGLTLMYVMARYGEDIDLFSG